MSGCLVRPVDLHGGDDRRDVREDESDEPDGHQRSRCELGQVDGVTRREQHDAQPDEDERQAPPHVTVRPAADGRLGRGFVRHGDSSCSMDVGNLMSKQLISGIIITF